MNTQLIADAVGNSRGDEEATIWDRLFAFWFRRLVYTQIWEDPVADLARADVVALGVFAARRFGRTCRLDGDVGDIDKGLDHSDRVSKA